MTAVAWGAVHMDRKRERTNDRIAWRDPRLLPGAVVAVLAAAVYLVFLPHLLVNSDEYFYAGQALALSKGHLFPVDGVGLSFPASTAIEAVKYPMAWPMLLALGRLLSARSMWLVALVLHLAGGMAFARIMVRRGIPAWSNALWLFHPVAWLYARTVMSDVPAAALLLVAIDAWEARDRWLGAAMLALVAWMRSANLLVLAGFGLAVLPQVRRRWRDGLAGGVAVMAALLAQHGFERLLTGAWFASPYSHANASLIGTGMVVENAALYLGGLLLLPPFPLAFAALRPRRVDGWVLVSVPVLAFLLFYRYHDTGTNLLQTFVGGQRFMLPAHAALLVATAQAWSRVWPFSSRWLLVSAGLLVSVLGAVAMRRLEMKFEPAHHAVRACAPATLGYNVAAGRVALSVDAERYLALDGRAELPPMDVVLVATQHESNRPGGTQDPRSGLRVPVPGRCYAVGVYRIYDLAGRCPPVGDPCPPER